jgi:hypothetical protein
MNKQNSYGTKIIVLRERIIFEEHMMKKERRTRKKNRFGYLGYNFIDIIFEIKKITCLKRAKIE